MKKQTISLGTVVSAIFLTFTAVLIAYAMMTESSVIKLDALRSAFWLDIIGMCIAALNLLSFGEGRAEKVKQDAGKV